MNGALHGRSSHCEVNRSSAVITSIVHSPPDANARGLHFSLKAVAELGLGPFFTALHALHALHACNAV